MINVDDSLMDILIQLVVGLIDDIFGNFGITELEIVFPESQRKRRQILSSNITAAVQQYGCWCSKPFTGNALGGQHIDEIDRICKLYARCNKCDRLSSCNGDASVGYSVSYDVVQDTYTCSAANECAMNACECHADFAMSLARYFADNGNSLDGSNMNLDASACVKQFPPAMPVDACCGAAPSWMPYSSLADQCVNGDIIPL